MNNKILALAVSGLFLSTSALADEASWTGLKIGIGGGGKYNAAKSTLSAEHDTLNEAPGNNPLGTDTENTTVSGSWASNYAASEIFNGTAEGLSDLGKAQGFATIDASFDWQLNDTFVFGLIANYDFGGKSNMNGHASGTGSAGWTEVYDYNTWSYTADGTGGSSPCSTEGGCTSYSSTPVNNGSNNGSSTSTTGMSSSFETGNSGALGARLGFLANKNTLIYATGGWSTIKYNSSATYNSHVDQSYGDQGGSDYGNGYGNDGSNSYDYTSTISDSGNKNGYFIGAGMQAKLTQNVSAKLEYRYSDYGTLRSQSNDNALTIDQAITGANQFEFGGSLSGTTSMSQTTSLNQHAIRAVVSYDF